MEKRKHPILSIVLYVIAGLFALYAIWAFRNSYSYVNELLATGQLYFSGNEFEIIDFYMSSCSSYAVYALIIFVLGYLTHKKQLVGAEGFYYETSKDMNAISVLENRHDEENKELTENSDEMM